MNSMYQEIFQNNVEYRVLPYQFFLLTFWGIWCPTDWSSKFKYVSKIWFTFVFFLSFLMCIEMTIHFLITIGTDKFKLINLFLVSANITGVYKAIRLMQTRESIRSFIRFYYNYQWMRSQDQNEIYINNKIDSTVRLVTFTYAASMLCVVFFKAMSPVAESSDLPLPVDAWYPYPVEKQIWFWLTYFHQVILGSSAVSAHVGIDTLIVGLLLKVSHRIKILQNRLEKLNNIDHVGMIEKKMLIQCISHQERIYRFGKDLNTKFREFLIILVVSSLPNICINVYTLSVYTADSIDIQYFSTIFTTTSAFCQVFIVCWFGNEISLNSLEIQRSVYEINWTFFDASTRKLLIIIMLRTSRPIQLSIARIIPMNLDSFIKIIKASYTAFNILQRTSN